MSQAMEGPREAGYRAAGFGSEVGFGVRPAVLAVDLMLAYFDHSSPMYAGVVNFL